MADPAGLDRYLDSLLDDERPSPHDVAGPDEARMARVAAELVAAGRVDTDPDPAFVDQLRLRMREVDEGGAVARATRPTAGPASRSVRVSRRQLLQAGVGVAAGIAAGAVGITLLRPAQTGPARRDTDHPLVADDGRWVQVATMDELPQGAVLRFSTEAFDGFIVNDGGEVRALSSVCTHMGCTLRFRPEQRDLRCPCHGASFDLRGELANGSSGWGQRGGYIDDLRAYPLDLPPLAQPEVKVEDDRVMIWTADA